MLSSAHLFGAQTGAAAPTQLFGSQRSLSYTLLKQSVSLAGGTWHAALVCLYHRKCNHCFGQPAAIALVDLSISWNTDVTVCFVLLSVSKSGKAHV